MHLTGLLCEVSRLREVVDVASGSNYDQGISASHASGLRQRCVEFIGEYLYDRLCECRSIMSLKIANYFSNILTKRNTHFLLLKTKHSR